MLQSAVRAFSAKKKSVVSRIDSRLEDGQKDAGSLLIDVLIGIAIVALVALIAVSTVGQYREKAAMAGMNEDAKTMGVAVEASAAAVGTYPTAAQLPTVTPASLSAQTVITTPIKVTLTKGNGYTYTPLTDSFSLTITRSGFTAAAYDSAAGGVTTLASK